MTNNAPHIPSTINLNKFADLTEVPVEKIIEAAQAVGGDNNFQRLLQTAQVYASMNVEPVFLINKDQTALRVAARELWESPNKLN